MVSRILAMTLLTYKEAAEYLRVAPKTLYDMVSRGQVPILKKKRGNSRLFCKELLDLWLLEGQPKTWEKLLERFKQEIYSQFILKPS